MKIIFFNSLEPNSTKKSAAANRFEFNKIHGFI